ncbi:MAG: magnesium/cobalt transporter CorA [Candidatus Omnitrophica bacterium]|nr:magnesium/cobalt transporter CorA [Candidatus Omnitrophota bacterium]
MKQQLRQRKRLAEIAVPPGTLVYVGDKKAEKVKITVFDYDAQSVRFQERVEVEACYVFRDTPSVTWINVDGIHDLSIIERIGKHFNLHPLILEDIVNTSQRPKMEDYGTFIFFVVKMLSFDPEEGELHSEQLSLILGKNFVISFQETEGDIFDAVRERIRQGKGRIRQAGADYLAYRLLDMIIDNYFVLLEFIGEQVEKIEEEIMSEPAPETVGALYDLRQNTVFLRRNLWPLREVLSGMLRSESELIEKNTGVFLRDAYDHTVQVVDTIESYRDTMSGLLDVYLSSITYRTNEIMKVLTMIATIFIPLTFITGIYGMNFHTDASGWNMPELKWSFGYLYVWGLMIATVALMLSYFKRQKWI